MSATTPAMATLSDFGPIWTLMREVAPQIPFSLESDTDQEAVLTELMACCTDGQSPLILDPATKKVMGALLVRRDPFEWGFRNSPALHVTYVAFAAEAPSGELVSGLMEWLMDRRVPLYFSVKSGNGLELPALLEPLGFAHLANNAWGDLYFWEPQKPH